MKEKNNLMLINYRSDIGGGTINMIRLIENIDRATYNCFVFCGNENPGYAKMCDLENKGLLHLIRLNIRKITPLSLFKIAMIARKKNIHIIHSHGTGAGIWSRFIAILFHVKVVHTFHGLHLDSYSATKKNVYRLFERCLSFLTNGYVCVSPSEAKIAIGSKLVKPCKVNVIANGIDSNFYSPLSFEQKKEAQKKYGLNENKVVIGCVARLSVQKNIFFMLECIKKLKEIYPDFIFLFACTEENFTFEELYSYIRKNKLEDVVVVINGNTEVKKVYDLFDIFLTTSLWEGLPTTILEASACGIPVVATKVTGNVDAVLDNKTGLLVNCKCGDVAAALHTLCLDDALKINMGKNGLEYIRTEFSIDKMIRCHDQLYRTLMTAE
ncbi:MAG: glycosyltransferase [Chitinispirillaceae bacterium]|nr:glycosyltransferase [Chitinispirillaceae bacterium]